MNYNSNLRFNSRSYSSLKVRIFCFVGPEYCWVSQYKLSLKLISQEIQYFNYLKHLPVVTILFISKRLQTVLVGVTQELEISNSSENLLEKEGKKTVHQTIPPSTHAVLKFLLPNQEPLTKSNSCSNWQRCGKVIRLSSLVF